MHNDSLGAFSFQMEQLLQKHLTFSKLSDFLDIHQSTLKSWVAKRRSPKLDNIDQIADKLGCYSYELLSFEKIIGREIKNNHSRDAFVRNLKKIFIDRYCYTQSQKYLLIENAVTYEALVSYLRNNNYRKPTLKVLDRIADELNIETYILLKEEYE